MKIRLSDPDQQRLGCPEWLDVANELDVADAEALESAGGDWRIYANAGPAAMRVRTWVALHRAGVTVTPFESLHFDVLNIQADAPSPGKAPSAKGGASTSSTSATSSRRSPRRRSAS